MPLVSGGMLQRLERVDPLDRPGDFGSRWLAFVGEAGDRRRASLPHLARITLVRGIPQLPETRIEPFLRCCDGKQPGR